MHGTIERRVKLLYPVRLLDQPILYQLITEFGVQVNVLEAQVNKLGGWLIVDLAGPTHGVLGALEWLAEQGIDMVTLPSAATATDS